MFVVFEGIDGSGKTTISNRVAEKLRQAGLSVEHLREGGKFSSQVTQSIREFGRDARNWELTPHAEFFLYVTRDAQLLDEMTRPALGRAEVVIADRFLYSAEVLSRFGRGLPEAMVRPVIAAAAGGIEPDLVVWVDVDPHLARARRRVAKTLTDDKRAPSRKGLAGVGMQTRFRKGYETLAAGDPKRWVVVANNDEALDAIVDRVFSLVRNAATKGVATAVASHHSQKKTAKPLPVLRSVEDALGSFLKWIAARATNEPAVAAHFLSGLWGPGIDEWRERLAVLEPKVTLVGLGGLDDPMSWKLRQHLYKSEPDRVARSLRGFPVEHPQASALRTKLEASVPLAVLGSYDGLDAEPAWALRDRLFSSNPHAVVATVKRLDAERAWQMRERYAAVQGGDLFDRFELVRPLLTGITGLDDDRAWEIRTRGKAQAPISALTSVSGLSSERSWQWRDDFLARAPKAVFATLRQVDDPRAWAMRESMAAFCKEAIDSIQDLDGDRAFALRDAHADRWPSTVIKSLGALARSKRGQGLVERVLAGHAGNLSLLKHASAIALGTYSGAEDVVD